MNPYILSLNVSSEEVISAAPKTRMAWFQRLLRLYQAEGGFDGNFIIFSFLVKTTSTERFIDYLRLFYSLMPNTECYSRWMFAIYHVLSPEQKIKLADLRLNFGKGLERLEDVYSREAATATPLIIPRRVAPPVPTVHQLVKIPDLNLNSHPGKITKYLTHGEIQLTLGDLHGNALKLIHFLVFHDVMDITPEQYARMVAIYHTKPELLTEKDLRDFCEILQTAKFNNSVAMIRFIGDMFSDRGSNDYFTFKILERLDEANVPFEIMKSNHDLGLYGWLAGKGVTVTPADSLINLNMLLKRKLISLKEVKHLLQTHYEPHLKLISYSLSRDSKKASLYTHARIWFKTIEEMAKALGVTLKTDSIENFFSSLDEINAAFSRHIKNKTLLTLLENALFPMNNPNEITADDDPFFALVWNKNLKAVTPLPAIGGTELELVHGHEPSETDDIGFVSLDTWFGKEFHNHSLAGFCEKFNVPAEEVEMCRALHDHRVLYSNHLPSHVLQERRRLALTPAAIDASSAPRPAWMPTHPVRIFDLAYSTSYRKTFFTPKPSDISDTLASTYQELGIFENESGFFKPKPVLFNDGEGTIDFSEIKLDEETLPRFRPPFIS